MEYLSEGLEGRSRYPVAVLFDTLLHPNADFGYEFPPVLKWRRDKHQQIPHLVLGKGTPGGAWHVSLLCISLESIWVLCQQIIFALITLLLASSQAMEGSMLTVSLGIWMELPGVNYSDLTNGKRR